MKKAALLLAAAGILYGSVFMSAIDQQAMYEGRKATKQIADLVAGELVAEGYYDLPEKLPVMLVGRPSAKPTVPDTRHLLGCERLRTGGPFRKRKCRHNALFMECGVS